MLLFSGLEVYWVLILKRIACVATIIKKLQQLIAIWFLFLANLKSLQL